MRPFALFLVPLMITCTDLLHAQHDSSVLWHGRERRVRYTPDGTDFVTVNGDRRFNRALYGTNTGFRVEAGDLPEFALYLPGMGGNLKFGLIAGNESKWLINAQQIEARYRPGSMIYAIQDPLLGGGRMMITVLALHDREGMIVKVEGKKIHQDLQLLAVYGGASGTRFSRDGDIGADPESSFYLKPEYCKDHVYNLRDNIFSLDFGPKNNPKKIAGVFPASALLKISDATRLTTPWELLQAKDSLAPVVAARAAPDSQVLYYAIVSGNASLPAYTDLPSLFEKAEAARRQLESRIILHTPDPYLNTLGGALAVAADAIWEDPSYLHGAVAWRMRLNAWRGAYVADPLGWHDRARKHFSSYALSQVTTPPVTGVVMDTALHLARHQEKIGTALFSDGYICRNPNGDIRAHHYDMNLVFVDQLLNHFNWTGDTAYVREMWPLIKRHLAWEKRNFDADGDGLYDAYAAIWASDALQYSGGGVTHSSAYNYRSNKTAAMLARLIGQDGSIYEQEAGKILNAIYNNLWLPGLGWYAEYKDALGKQLVHPSAGLWTIYHAIDSKVPNSFQAFQALRYIDTEIPHIPVNAKQWKDEGMYLLSTTNWQPYTWSINNVALAENLHTALAYWQGNCSEEAYVLWRSALLESMYLGASPGGFQQLSFYDAMRGELYRDFADGLGIAARTLVEGLFGVQPDALNDTLLIQPGLPMHWNHASLQVPDVHFHFTRNGNTDRYELKHFFKKNLNLKLVLTAHKDNIEQITVNGKPMPWKVVPASVGKPMLELRVPAASQYDILVKWNGNKISSIQYDSATTLQSTLKLTARHLKMLAIYDPQLITNQNHHNNLRSLSPPQHFSYSVNLVPSASGNKTFFVQVTQGAFTWWHPISFLVKPPKTKEASEPAITANTIFEKVSLSNYFNDKINNIFTQQYLSPRPASPTLQLPTQGIGNWCYPLTMASINDSGLRRMAGPQNEIRSLRNVPFATPSGAHLNNIIYTSQWDNYPDSAVVPLSGKASHVYLLMAGSTNPMQSRFTNGMVTVQYTDGSSDSLLLRNPENWWPIEQDYYIDGFAFTTGAPHPERLYLKEGKFAKGLPAYSSIRGFSNRAIDGGAATVLHMPLNAGKTLQSLTVHAIANDVVIGLMAATLVK